VRLRAKTRCLRVCVWFTIYIYIYIYIWLLYMGGRVANVRVYWTGYGREKGPWRFLTCGEDLWTVRPFVCPYTRTAYTPAHSTTAAVCVLTHKRLRSYFMLYTLAHTHIIYRGNTVVGRALSLGECRGGVYIYSYSRLVVKAKSFCVYRPLPPVPSSLFCSPRATHVRGVREMLLKRHKHRCLHRQPLEPSSS